jgi:hypothetical protein
MIRGKNQARLTIAEARAKAELAKRSVRAAKASTFEPSRLGQTTNTSVSSIGSVSALEAATKPRHRWYFFKEAFSPEIVDRAVADIASDSEIVVVDPFCGSGTVPLQVALKGHRAAGLEVNPFLAFVARAKLTQCRKETFEARAEDVLALARKGRTSPLVEFSTFSNAGLGRDGKKKEKWLFNRPVLEAFEGGWHAVEASDAPAQRLVKLCLLGAATEACNATKDGKALRYRMNWRAREFGSEDFIAAFEERVAVVAEDLQTTPLDPDLAKVYLGDSRRRTLAGSFRLCITSPPYLNSFDYTDVYRPELFLGRWVKDMRDLRDLRLKTLRSHVQVEWENPREDDFGAHYMEAIERIRPLKTKLWSSRIPLMVQAYFEDMRRVLKRLRKAAAENASVWIVVSTSAYGGIEIPVDLITADIGTACGWYLREVSVLRYLGRVAGQQWVELAERSARNLPHLRESVIILDAKPRIGPRDLAILAK